MTSEDIQAWYAYCVLLAGNGAPPVEGVLPHTRVEAIPFGAVTVLASQVSRSLFDRENPANCTDDPAWMAERLEAHHAVNVAASVTGPCLPLAFGALFSSHDVLRDWVAPRTAALQAALQRLSGHAEWALSLGEDAVAHAAWLDRHDPDVSQLAGAVAAAGQGTAFLMARRLDKARAAARLTHAAATGRTVAQHLTTAGYDLLEEPPRSGLPSWAVLAPIASADPGQSDGLSARVGILAAEMTQAGLSLRLSGPWPAYSFARAALVEEATHG